MTKTRNLSDLLDSNGDVKSTALDNVPASNDASALTTGTLPNARLSAVPNSALANSSITINGTATALGGSISVATTDASSLTTGTLDNARLPSSIDISGTLTANGASFTADVTLGDNDTLRIGTGGDLTLGHDGTHSYITDVGTGNLYVRASNDLFLTNADTTKAYFRGTNSGASTLYYDNSQKLTTSTSGVSVTGTVSATSFSGSGLGKIGNVVQGVKGDTASSASSGFVAISGLNATITPSSTSSKILASVNVNVGQSTNTTMMFKLYRGTQAVGNGTANGVRQTVGFRVSPDNIHWTFPASYQYLDSPSTTSAITYYVYWASNGATMYINRNNSFGNDTSNDQSIPISTITLMEILP